MYGAVSSKSLLQRPIAGSQVPFCPLEKRVSDSWSRIEAATFKVRAENYFRDKKKDFAPKNAAYYPFGVDVFLCPRKINHISQLVELPVIESSGMLPPILVVNIQVSLISCTTLRRFSGLSFYKFNIKDNNTPKIIYSLQIF
nr:Protein ENHANCED DISEASE RESISTANCE like [Ipomoea batatas]